MASAGLPPRPADSKGKSWVFNSPPGWPAPPEGWLPPPGWHPDPLWPPAPDGWEFWKPASGRKRPGFSFYVKTAAGVLTLAATLAGAYFAFRSQPHSPTTAEWVSQANAACDRDIGSVQMSFFNALLPASDQTADQNASAGQQLANRLRNLIAVEGDLSKINGDLAAQPMPGDSRVPAVRAVLLSGNALVGSLDTYSGALQSDIDSGATFSAAQVAAEAKNGDVVLARQLAWQKAIGALGLTSCPFWTAHPARAAPTVAPSAATTPPATTQPATTPSSPAPSLTESEQQLADQLSSDDLTNCVGRPALETDGVVAAINCDSAQFGPTERPLVVQFSNADSAQAWFQANTSNFVNENNCADGYEVGTWDHNGVMAGPWGCAYVTGGDFRMVWVAYAPLIGVVADGSSGSAMYSWWTDWGYVLSGAG